VNVLVLSELDAAQRSEVAGLLARCEEADGHSPLAEPQEKAVARVDLGGHGAVAFLAHDEGSLLVGFAILTPATDGATALHVAVDPGHRGPSVRPGLIEAALEHSAGPVRLWIMQARPEDDREAGSLGFQPERDLLQMRVPLPLPDDVVASARPVATRSFRAGQDDAAWLDINNRAFAGHPEQGGWSEEELQVRLDAPWFDPDGFLMADAQDGSDLIGSCWTKVHRDVEPVLGEIYIISVDPDRHSQGWGRALTVAGLQWMAGQGVRHGMLYTTADNTAAVALYESLGFRTDHVDRSYRRLT
jgi:mycothiol synthase